jgi:aminoacyl tRNA synthase complex-interacting multifunctional protein 1
VERKAEPPKKKGKSATATPVSGIATSTANAKVETASVAEKDQKKEKKEKKKGGGDEGNKKAGGSKATLPADEGEPVPSMIDLRVGHIVDGTVKSLFLSRC